MQVYTTTIASTGTKQPIVPNTVTPDRVIRFQNAILQNRGTNNMDIGDGGVVAGKGLLLTASGSLGATQPLAANSDLQDFWVIGTAGDVLVAMIFG